MCRRASCSSTARSLANAALIGAGTTLGGTGTIVGTVSVAAAGFLSPGNSPGILNVGNTTLAAGSTFQVEITGNTPGVGRYDQLNVTGSVVIDTAAPGVALALSFPAPPYTPQLGDQYVIINNDGNDPVTGTFAGLLEAATINPDFGGSLCGSAEEVGAWARPKLARKCAFW